MALENFSWVIPDKLAGCAFPGGGSTNTDHLRSDLRELYDHGVRILVSLERTPKGFAARCREEQLEQWPLALPDFGTPPDLDAFESLVMRICEALKSNLAVCVHCRAGIGRTGMLLACVMGRYFLLDGQQAIAAVRTIRSAVETPEQIDIVERFCTTAH